MIYIIYKLHWKLMWTSAELLSADVSELGPNVNLTEL